MNKYNHYKSKYSHYKREYHHTEKPLASSKIMGVCAGVAQQFDWDVTAVRLVAILCLITFTVPTFLAYIVAGSLFY